MANVKFNRGLEATLLGMASEPTNDITVTKVTSEGNYDSLYIGKQMIGTSLLRKMNPSSMPVPTFDGESVTWTSTTPASGTSLVITADYGSTTQGGTSSPIVTARTLVNAAGVAASGYAATDSQILTAAAVEALITNGGGYYTAGGWNYNSAGWSTWTALHSTNDSSKNFAFTLPMATVGESYDASTDTTHLLTAAQIYALATGNDTYHRTGAWGTSDAWKTYTAKYYKGGTEITSGTTGYQALSFTLPVHTWSDASAYAADNATLTTPYQVAQYLATFTSAMNYRGSLTSAMAGGTHSDAYQIGDVFIAGGDIASIGAEAGDMVVVNTAIPANTAFVSTGDNKNCDVFERNLDGAVTADETLAENHMIVGDTADKEVKSVSYITVDTANTDLVIAHTVNGTTTNINVADTLMWHDLT